MLNKILHIYIVTVLSFSSLIAMETRKASDTQTYSTGAAKLITIIKPDNTKIVWEVNTEQKLSDLRSDLIRANIIEPKDIVFQKDGASIVQDLCIGEVVNDGFLTMVYGSEVLEHTSRFSRGGFVRGLLSDAKFWVTTAICLNGFTVQTILHYADSYCKQAGQCSPFLDYPVDIYDGMRNKPHHCTPVLSLHPCDKQTMFVYDLVSGAMMLAPVFYVSTKILYRWASRR